MKTASLIFLIFAIIAVKGDRSFGLGNGTFVKDGKTHQIISGSLHYWRVLPAAWQDRLDKMKAGGLNAVMTYIPWNLHNPQPNLIRFDGGLHLVQFVKLAQKTGLDVILRPSPYICAEFEFGGHPYWLFNDPSLTLRANNPAYLKYWGNFLDHLAPLLFPLQYSLGGPIIAFQIENEYGSWGGDVTYTQALKDAFTSRRLDRTLLFQSNGNGITGGNLPGLLHTLNCPASNKNMADQIATLQKNNPGQPAFVTEFWDGWFDTWGQKTHSTTNAQMEAKNVDWLLSNGHSLSFYMYNGGTNFGFTNGAEFDGSSITTSYDYDCALDERGNYTLKYQLFTQIIKRHFPNAEEKAAPAPTPVASYGSITFAESYTLNFQDENSLSKVGKKDKDSSAGPLNFEITGQDFGFKLYKTFISGKSQSGTLKVKEVKDMAVIWNNNVQIGTITRHKNDPINFTTGRSGSTLHFFVENQGRINFGGTMSIDKKGIYAPVEFSGAELKQFSSWSFPFESVAKIPFISHLPKNPTTPTFYRGTLNVPGTPADTWISLPGWIKGNVWINDFNIGRFNSAGPQKNLYVPNSILKTGKNQIVVFEIFQNKNNTVSFVNRPDLG